MQAGSRNVRFNSPLGGDRASALANWLGEQEPTLVVDLGCGRGGFLRELRRALPAAELHGVDSDSASIHDAAEGAAHLHPALRLTHGAAVDWQGPADAAVCIGSSHAFGGSEPMLARMAALVPRGCAVVGDGIFDVQPGDGVDPWCQATFGDLPRGVRALAESAVAAGWSVEATGSSTLAEWDAFEQGWIAGVRALGTPEAIEFANARAADYPRYRGVLGFGWLQLTRS